jgi:hypothetical protein
MSTFDEASKYFGEGSAEAREKLLRPTPRPDSKLETSKATASKEDVPLSRNEILLGPVPRAGHLIEIGPSYNPIAPKREGWNIRRQAVSLVGAR